MIHRLGRVLLIVYLLETGLVLVLAPWSTFWERNVLIEVAPLFGGVMRLGAVRGAVSGVGLVNVYAGLWELAIWLAASWSRVGASGRRPSETEGETVSRSPW